MKRDTGLPDPTADSMSLWLKTLDKRTLHNQGWIEANSRFHGITRGMRAFINRNYNDPKEQEAAFDGATLALMAMAHFDDIDKLSALFGTKNTSNRKKVR